MSTNNSQRGRPLKSSSSKFGGLVNQHHCVDCNASFYYRNQLVRHWNRDQCTEERKHHIQTQNMDFDVSDFSPPDEPSSFEPRTDRRKRRCQDDTVILPTGNDEKKEENPQSPRVSLDNVSTLYDDFKYPENLSIESDWFPFDSKSDALIYLWDSPGTSNRLPSDQLTSLLLLQAFCAAVVMAY